jgi:hypothetical protein
MLYVNYYRAGVVTQDRGTWMVSLSLMGFSDRKRKPSSKIGSDVLGFGAVSLASVAFMKSLHFGYSPDFLPLPWDQLYDFVNIDEKLGNFDSGDAEIK